jgi:nucleoside-diphosphate-sugar epimerase
MIRRGDPPPASPEVDMSTTVNGRRIALIGGAGFIGHHLALALAQRGALVEVVDSLQVNNLLAFSAKMPDLHNRELYLQIIHERLDLLRLHGIPLHPLDARDYHALGHLLTEQIKPEVIVHLAAVAHAGRSNKDPYSTFDHSLRTLENALDCARNNVRHFIYLSSSMVYGNFLTEQVEEDHPLDPIGIYGALKLAGEKMVIAYQQVFDLPYTIIRPSALYGARCVSRRVGQVFIESALNGSVLRVDGDGSERLDFTYVDDLVDGIILAMERPEGRNQVFNLTYGHARSIRELVDITAEHFPGVGIQYVERDRLMPFRGTLSVAKARRLLGYQPSHPIEAGFPKYIAWYKRLVGVPVPEVVASPVRAGRPRALRQPSIRSW